MNGFRTILVVIETDCTGSSKSNNQDHDSPKDESENSLSEVQYLAFSCIKGTVITEIVW